MAEKRLVGEAVLRFLRDVQLPGLPEELVSRRSADSLPAEPEEGAVGRQHLLHDLDVLQELRVEGRSA